MKTAHLPLLLSTALIALTLWAMTSCRKVPVSPVKGPGVASAGSADQAPSRQEYILVPDWKRRPASETASKQPMAPKGNAERGTQTAKGQKATKPGKTPPGQESTARPQPVTATLSGPSGGGGPSDGGGFALTFDDGPHPVHTPALLAWLKAGGYRATFFLCGENVRRYPALVRQIVAEGHELGNHTWSHPFLPKVSDASLLSQLRDTHEAIIKACGQAPRYFRPPFGALTLSQRKRVVDTFGYDIVLWDTDSLDWKLKDATLVSATLSQQLSRGDIVLGHDIHPWMLESLKSLEPSWASQGLRPVALKSLREKNKSPVADTNRYSSL